MHLRQQPFGVTPDGHAASLYNFSNDRGLEISITNYGGAVTSIKAPDRNGNVGDLVLGYDTLAEYVKHARFLGAVIG